ncbi:MAG TPA: acyl-CoA desaturase [Thermoleophilaceae bacterium]|nr:acyl-CoA desaturase [Thermoleophilaceae bacterium]
MAATATPRDDVQPVANENLDRFLTGTITVLPILALGVVAWQLWSSLLGWSDLIVFAIMYVSTGLGITVGFHRLFTHRSFKTGKAVRAILAAFGSMAIEGPVISWVADHRKHHVYSDQPGDPHSPHVDHGHGLKGALRGLLHAHVGWLFIHTERGLKTRYAPDLIADPIVNFISRTFVLWVTVGLVAPFLLGWAIGGSVATALTGLLWGGAVRMLVLHHATYSINSLCHFFGRRRFRTGDESRNLWWLSFFTFGEAWHNNHHAFPTSANHGLRFWQIDISAWVIRALEAVGLAWDVQRPSAERMAARAQR